MTSAARTRVGGPTSTAAIWTTANGPGRSAGNNARESGPAMILINVLLIVLIFGLARLAASARIVR